MRNRVASQPRELDLVEERGVVVAAVVREPDAVPCAVDADCFGVPVRKLANLVGGEEFCRVPVEEVDGEGLVLGPVLVGI